jgi:methionyl-tRNA formyltransferase
MKKLRIVFMGTPDFAVPALSSLLETGQEIVGVITSPDRPAGRGQKLTTSPVKDFALSKGLHILQPANLKSPDFIEQLKALKADLQVVVAFRMLPEQVWSMPSLGTFNLHASLLPDYRGAAPINWAIINGEKHTGVTTFFLRHEIDTGAILFQEKIAIGDKETAGQLHDRLMEAGANLVVKTVEAIASETVSAIEQEQLLQGRLPKIAPKLNKENIRIAWDSNSKSVFDFIRGLSPYPAAHSSLFHPTTALPIDCKILLAEIASSSHLKSPGTIETDGKNYIHVHCSDGMLDVIELQLSGKQRMKVKDLLNGFRMDNSWCFK